MLCPTFPLRFVVPLCSTLFGLVFLFGCVVVLPGVFLLLCYILRTREAEVRMKSIS